MSDLAVSRCVVTRADVEAHIETLITLLDEFDGDADLEDGDEDCCAAHDDDTRFLVLDAGPGDPDDSEDGDQDRCQAGDDGCGTYFYNGAHSGSQWDEDFRIPEFSDPTARAHHRGRIRRDRCLRRIQRWRGWNGTIEQRTVGYRLCHEPMMPTRRQLFRRKRGVPNHPRP